MWEARDAMGNVIPTILLVLVVLGILWWKVARPLGFDRAWNREGERVREATERRLALHRDRLRRSLRAS